MMGDLESKAVEMTKTDMSNKLRDITNNFKGTEQVVPLYVFKDVFLPYFDMRVDLDTAKREQLFDMWVSKVATTISSPVRVVDDNDPDITLILVPPLMDTAGVSINQENMSKLETSLKIHSMKKNGMPELADKELNNSLVNTEVEYTDTHGDDWLKFYEYFDLPVAVIDGEYKTLSEMKLSNDEEVKESTEISSNEDLLDNLFG